MTHNGVVGACPLLIPHLTTHFSLTMKIKPIRFTFF